MNDTTQAQHLKAAAQQALTVLRGCLEHPDAGDAISALQHAIAQPAKPEPVQVDAWQPITTAPKDKRIFLYWPKIFGGCIYGGHWERDTYAKKPVPYWTSDISRIVGLRELRALPPTHWLPVPAPPTQAE